MRGAGLFFLFFPSLSFPVGAKEVRQPDHVPREEKMSAGTMD